jgi:predicted  nucleic acid-binding Zn-ribbon protein
MPVEKLKFEYEKRQRNISTLQMKASSLTRDYEQSERECDEYQEEQRSHGERHPEAIGGDYRNRLAGEIMSAQSQISDFEAEMNAIEKVVDANWK